MVLVCFLGSAACSATRSTLLLRGYGDTRGATTATLTGALLHDPSGLRLFGFQDVESVDGNPKTLEIQFSKRVYQGLGLVTEYNRNLNRSKGSNRLGLIYFVPLPDRFQGDRLAFKYHFLSSANRGVQLGVSGRKNFPVESYVEGFFEYNLRPDNIVSEVQFGKQLTGPWFLVAEFRQNGFRSNSRGVGIGMELKLK